MKDLLFILGPEASGKTRLAQMLKTGNTRIIETDQPFHALKQLNRAAYDERRHFDLIVVSSRIKPEDVAPGPNVRIISLTHLKASKHPAPLNELAADIHKGNVARGYWKRKDFCKKLLLITSEVVETMEADRKGKYAAAMDFLQVDNAETGDEFMFAYEARIKGTVEEEVADIHIRSLDFAAGNNIDIDGHIRLKRRYTAIKGVDKRKKY